MRVRFSRLLIYLVVVILAGVSAEPVAHGADSRAGLERQIFAAFGDGDYQRADVLISGYLERWPNDFNMHYNHACAYAQMGEADLAATSLKRAVELGFRQFEHMISDPDLESIRQHEVFQAIVEAHLRVRSKGASHSLEEWKKQFGHDGYRFEIDEERKVVFAAALDSTAFEEMKRMLQEQEDHLLANLFALPPEEYVLIAIPKPEDTKKLFAGQANVAGRYEHVERRIVARDIGGTLRHEFVHALHYAHMERLGLQKAHPLWLQEGLATLYEDYRVEADGSFTFLPNGRLNVAKNLARSGRLTPWKTLFETDAKTFMRRAGQNYPQVRAIFEYIAEQGRLGEWYQTYIALSAEDPSGYSTFARVFGKPTEEVEQSWRQWLLDRPGVDLRVDRGDPVLGIEVVAGASNSGVVIDQIIRGSAASRTRLRRGDVIVALDRVPVRNLTELWTELSRKLVGDTVEVRARRKEHYFEVRLRLQPYGHMHY